MDMAVFWHFFVSAGCVRLTGTKTDLWITTRSMEWKPLRGPFLFCCQKCPRGLCPHKRLDKNAPGNGEKKKGGKKNE